MLTTRLTLPGSQAFSTAIRGDVGPLGAHLDGIVDHQLRGGDLTGNVDGKLLTFAARIRADNDNAFATVYQSVSSKINLTRFSLAGANALQVILKIAAGSTLYSTIHTNAWPNDNAYHNFLFSINTNPTAIAHFFVDDVSQSVGAVTTNAVIDFTETDHAIGAATSGAFKMAGDFNFVSLDGVYYDFNMIANRRLFFDASGDPVLNPNGNGTPAGGVQPIVYQAGLFDTWHINKGTGGGFTENGAYTQPPD